MSSKKELMLDWVESGQLSRARLEEAMQLAGVTPNAAAWMRFLSQLLLWMGAVMLGAAVVFFFAYNWQAMGRYLKFGLVEAPLLLAVLLAWYRGMDTVAGKAAIFCAAILTGALLALVGQTYQTGADTYELFLVWAVAILPWTLSARLPALWLFNWLLVNAAIYLYFTTFRGVFGFLFSNQTLLTMLFGFNALCWLAWEGAAQKLDWLRQRWTIRCVGLVASASVTFWAAHQVFGWRTGAWALLIWAVWMGLTLYTYRHRIHDLFMLACCVLSAIIVVTSILIKLVMEGRGDHAFSFLFIGLSIIGMSGAGAWWLKVVAKEQRQ